MRAADKQYPQVAGEYDTLAKIVAGASIARYGDGEFNHVAGRKNVSQVFDPKLQAELTNILMHPPKGLLVGIPTMDPTGPKYGNWATYRGRYVNYLNPKVQYYSAFITRPDSAPWINTERFYDQVESLWKGRIVTLVGNGERSLKPDFLLKTGALHVDFVQCSYRDSYAQIDDLEAQCLRHGNGVLLCAGPTATCLAARLHRKGLHAVDLGHCGFFWRPYANPKKKEKK